MVMGKCSSERKLALCILASSKKPSSHRYEEDYDGDDYDDDDYDVSPFFNIPKFYAVRKTSPALNVVRSFCSIELGMAS